MQSHLPYPVFAVVAILLWSLISAPAHAQLKHQGSVAQTFTQVCGSCHGNAAVKNAPDPAKLRQLSPESIYAALTTGAMRVQAASLSDGLKRDIVIFLTGRAPGLEAIADARRMPNRCPTEARLDLSLPAWNGFGVDAVNSRFQPAAAAGLSASQLPQLRLRWAFGFPGAAVVYSQPTVVGGRVFIGVDTGYVYALDAQSGCVYWSFQARAGVRSAISVGPVGAGPAARDAAYFGDIQGHMYAVDARSGELLWSVAVDTHPAARVTGAPTLYARRLYVPISSMEEGMGAAPGYACCTFRGSVVALDADTGRLLWKRYMIAARPKPLRKNSQGTQLWGPAGGGVWGAPVIDPSHHALYVATGDAYNGEAPDTTDALIALDMRTGRMLWHVQDTLHDSWIAGCGSSPPAENCPQPLGPDYDFGASLILRNLADGHRLLIAGQKSGFVWAHDPDAHGALVWKADVAPGRPKEDGEIVWGGTANGDAVYFGLNSGGIAALRVADGQRLWLTRLQPQADRADHTGQSGPLSSIPGAVISDGWDGIVRILSSDNGQLLWQFDTVQSFRTVNAVAAKGGSMGAVGPTVAAGILFVPSGYVGVQDGMPGNVLLAFSP